ncbi:hypothetical protein HMI48_01360 [Acidithiobacillus ferrooxidans]|uniref:hypothetical protein n=1 Tax=Acidithiobacillus ferrooxidans TaxID=920 RepID=UPI001C0781E5|nr:hypothetical protein [Acidithiobacillus ferrooxidans]MBU2772608.1 hypothetical protein [Acidithiobacillus ferrooxidans]
MSTEILKFSHDDGPDYQVLIGLVGHFISNPVIPARLGAPISTKPGDIWLVAKEAEKPSGCCIITLHKNGAAKLHGLYVAPYEADNALYLALVRRAAEEVAAAQGKLIRHTTLTKFADWMTQDGWKPGQARGKYITFEKEL